MIATGFIALAAEEPGLYAFELTSGGFALSSRLAPLERVHALVVDDRHESLFAAHSTQADGEDPSGRVVRYRLDRAGKRTELVRLADAPSGGTTPCHLAVAGDRLFAANFRAFGTPGGPGAASQGSLGVSRIEGEGGLAFERSVRFPGSSTHPERQTCSHPHCVVPFTGESVLVADLGTDRIWRYRYGADASYECALELRAGSGPRHLALSQAGGRLYVVNEIASTVCACTVGTEGELRMTGEVSIRPQPQHGASAAGDVAVSPDGRTVVATNRGQHSVALLTAGDGAPVVLDHLHLQGSPGDFLSTADGHVLVPAGSTLVVCRIGKSPPALAAIASHDLPGRISALCCRR